MRKTIRFMSVAVFAALLALPVLAGMANGGEAGAPGAGDTLEFVSCFGPGGGHDTMLRHMEKAIRTGNILSNPIIYTYKPGGNMAVGMQYTKSQAGRGDILMAATNQLIGVPLQMDIGVKREELTDMAVWGAQYLVFWVLKEKAEKEGWKTLDDMLKSGKPVTFTSPGGGSFEEILPLYLETQIPNADFRSIAVDGDAEAMTQLLGGHLDCFINEFAGGGLEAYIASGDVIGLACAGSKRSVYGPEIPTLRELGYDFALDSFRGLMGPPNMSPEALAWWQDLLSKIKETDSFKEYMVLNGIEPNFMIGKELTEYFDNYKKSLITAFTLADIEMVPNP